MRTINIIEALNNKNKMIISYKKKKINKLCNNLIIYS